MSSLDDMTDDAAVKRPAVRSFWPARTSRRSRHAGDHAGTSDSPDPRARAESRERWLRASSVTFLGSATQRGPLSHKGFRPVSVVPQTALSHLSPSCVGGPDTGSLPRCAALHQYPDGEPLRNGMSTEHHAVLDRLVRAGQPALWPRAIQYERSTMLAVTLQLHLAGFQPSATRNRQNS